jgi:hypothetical protein
MLFFRVKSILPVNWGSFGFRVVKLPVGRSMRSLSGVRRAGEMSSPVSS